MQRLRQSPALGSPRGNRAGRHGGSVLAQLVWFVTKYAHLVVLAVGFWYLGSQSRRSNDIGAMSAAVLAARGEEPPLPGDKQPGTTTPDPTATMLAAAAATAKAAATREIPQKQQQQQQQPQSQPQPPPQQSQSEREPKRPPPVDMQKPGGPIQRPPEYDPYLPKHNPVWDEKSHPLDTNNPVQVRVFTGVRSRLTPPSEFLADGVERSHYAKLLSVSFIAPKGQVEIMRVNNAVPDQPVVWMVDFASLHQDCHSLEMMVEHGLHMDGKATKRQLFIVDYTGSHEQIRCHEVEEELGIANIRLARRGIVRDRHWDRTKEWVDPGSIVPYKEQQIPGTMLASLALRETYMEKVVPALQKRYRKGLMPFARKQKFIVPYQTKRSIDVMLCWREGSSAHYGFLRRKVSAMVEALDGAKTGRRQLRTRIRAYGDYAIARNQIANDYVYQMMGTKAMIVPQRDEWEDHYRILESLASGALVFTDRMLSLPEGLVDGENIVVFDSEQHLKELILHYLHPNNDDLRLAIARNGWEEVMGRHRGWHQVETMLFGRPLTQVDQPYKRPPPRKERANFMGNVTKAIVNIEARVTR